MMENNTLMSDIEFKWMNELQNLSGLDRKLTVRENKRFGFLWNHKCRLEDQGKY